MITKFSVMTPIIYQSVISHIPVSSLMKYFLYFLYLDFGIENEFSASQSNLSVSLQTGK